MKEDKETKENKTIKKQKWLGSIFFQDYKTNDKNDHQNNEQPYYRSLYEYSNYK